ncbi:hypothetical protein ABW19_dt0210568 [Dactylella cylindrospora]|nr:hypothetical protein ABW19_dt0210568 [Dactylella cylindrospora]
MSLPSTFKAAVINEVGGKFSLQDLPLTPPKHGEVLVKVIASGICGSDVHVINGRAGAAFPHVTGHEIIGEVAAIPETEDHWKVGDRVGGGWHGGHCGFCIPCKRGKFLLCEHEAINGVTRWGGHAEFVHLRREAIVSVPTDVDPASYAPILCAGVTVFNSLRNMGIRPGGVVAISGLGGLGHLALQYAAKMGYKVVALSSSPAKREEALGFGAKRYVDQSKEDAVKVLKELGGADCALITANSAKIMSDLQASLAPGGTLLTIALAGPASFLTNTLVTQQLTVRGWPAGSSIDSEEAIDFAKHFGVECVVQKFPLEKVQEAYDIVDRGKVRYRSVLVL